MKTEGAAPNERQSHEFEIRTPGYAAHRCASSFAMRIALAILVCALCASCSTVKQKAPPQRAIRSVVLPVIAVPGVRTDHQLQEQEVAALASEYLKRFVTGCGMPDRPVDSGGFWSVQLWGGYAGTDYGRFLISKNGQQVTLEPPRSGLKSSTRSLLSHNGFAVVVRDSLPPGFVGAPPPAASAQQSVSQMRL
jgi:hypothetical protein